MTKFPIIVAGMGRCGSSLLMQMLSSAGVKCLGEFPAFEPDETSMSRDPASLLKMGGTAMKILGPHRDAPKWRRFDAKIIWLNRDVKEQARSQVKFLREVAGFNIPASSWRGMAASLKSDKWKCCDWWNRCNIEPLFVKFEDLILHPEQEARVISKFIGIDNRMYWPIMADCVIPRNPKCTDDMGIEMALVARAEGR